MTDPKSTLTFGAKVTSVAERFNKVCISGFGDNAKFEDRSFGWFIGLERSHELLFAGMSRPNVNVGDEAIIRINFYAPTSLQDHPR